ncbi:MAG: hypothetical protein H6686_10630 [Fibrobacteria bacterium]|nr:hypothetical protein [Fibrobacteria bacterium]
MDIRDLPPAWGDSAAHLNAPPVERGAPDAIGAWPAPRIEEQLEADEVLLGIGEGAIFVPSMTHGRLEPRVSVLDDKDEVVALGSTGKRIRLQPGSYRIRFGSGAEDQRLEIPVEVRDGETTVPPIPWCGLTVATISPERQYLRGEYKLIRQDRFQGYGEGFGQTEDRLVDLPTWILPPGVYKLTGLAAGTDDLTNFVTVRLIAGEWVEYTLVMDEDRVVGGGRITEVATESGRDRWRFGADIGGSLAWTREKLARQSNLRTTTNITGVTQLRARKETDVWLSSARLQFVGGAAMVGSDGWKVSPDEISTQVFTVRRVTPRIGPYGRLVGTSHLFPANIDLSSTTDPLRLYVRDPESGRLTRRAEGGQYWQYASPLAPLELREGLGLNIEALQFPALEVSLQAGVASRQVIPFGSYFQKDLENPSLQQELWGVDSLANITNAIVMEQAVFEHGTGFEATGDLRARLGSSASLTMSPGAFWSLWPRDRMEFTMTSVLSLHLTRHLTADLRYTVKRSLDEGVIHRYPYSLQSLLRFSFGA